MSVFKRVKFAVKLFKVWNILIASGSGVRFENSNH